MAYVGGGRLTILVLLGSLLLVRPVCAESPAGDYYTAYNMWYENPRSMRVINYKMGTLLPAGTAVNDIEVRAADPRNDDQLPTIRFKSRKDGRQFQVLFVPRWHPGKTVDDYAQRMFTRKDFQTLTASLTSDETDAIRRGAVIRGMSKPGVLIAYGYPPEHRTPSLDGNIWTYWRNKLVRKRICFDTAERAVPCRSPNDL